ncbi:hypothetical protein [Nocardia tengchongensis]|uniref:hypothetical protein n=1 Tax=Nocardia tengchongensis TaxID=2055889 RepID=UPI003679A137
MTNIRKAGLSAAGFAAISATIAIAAPFATADTTVNGLTVSGSGYTVGQTYTITVVTGSPSVSANVFDTTGSSTVSIGTATPASGTATTAAINWTPTSAGTHHITVTLNGAGQSVPVGPVDITVSATAASDNGLDTGSAAGLLKSLGISGSSANARVS